jgi:hypothetical protein
MTASQTAERDTSQTSEMEAYMLNRFLSRFGWIIFLLLAGVYLLLNNLGVIGPWGDLIWGALFAAIGLGFLIWFFVDRTRWWRVIPGFTLLAAGAVIALEAQQITLGNWAGAIVLFGIALAFWALLLRRGDFWWALLPAGVLTVTSILVGVRAQLPGQVWTAALLIGLGLVFLLLYFTRLGQTDTRWAIIPAGWLLLLGLITLVGAFDLPALADKWWPALLILLALVLLVLAIIRRPKAAPAAPKPAPAQGYATPTPAPGASVTQMPTTAPAPAPKATPAAEPEIDIYKLIEQQPKDPKA